MTPRTTPHVDVQVVRRYQVSPDRLFAAWLDPVIVGRWMFGPEVRDEEVIRIAIDARPEGLFSFVVRRQGEEIDHLGRYLELERPRRLVFTWMVRGESSVGSCVVVEIDPLETGAVLTLRHELPLDWADFADRTEAGWMKMLDALDRTLG